MKIIVAIAIITTAAVAAGKTTTKPQPHIPPKSAQHGGAHNKTGKIVGGDPASTGQFPYMASLKSSTYFVVCGGSIMCDRWILTAAHCNNRGIEIVGVGSTYLGQQNEYQIQYFIPHPFFNESSMFNDIMLIKTSKPMILIPGVVQPIAINTNPYIDNYGIKNMVLAGWGQYYYDYYGIDWGYRTSSLYWIYYDMQSPSTCQSYNSWGSYGTPLPYDSSIQSCGLAHDRYNSYPGACYGDFGGPLVYGFVQYGVASRLMYFNYYGQVCSYNYPSVFTKVSQYANWIAQTQATY